MQIDKDELIRRIKAARLVDCSDPEAAVLAIVEEMTEAVYKEEQRRFREMKILDTTNGHIHKYGSDPHDSLAISQDGCALHYYNLQCGEGSMFGTYRFVMEDGKIPAESQTEDAMYAECYFNIGGFGNSEDKPAWQRVKAKVKELEDAIAKCERAEKEFKNRTCKFRSPINCDLCAFHSDCEEHWKEGETE